MEQKLPKLPTPLLALIGLASVIIIAAAIIQLKSIITPLLLAILFFVLFSPILHWLRKARIPNWLSILITLAIMVLLFTVGINLLAVSLKGFVSDLPYIVAKLEIRINNLISSISWLPDDLAIDKELSGLISSSELIALFTSSLQGLLGALSNLLLIVLLVLFMLLEATHIRSKISGLPQQTGESIIQLTGNIKRYLVIKASFSLLTGVLIGMFLWIYGIKYPLLFGAIAFLLNFIPTIGSIVAAVPTLMLVAVDHSFIDLIVVLCCYLTVNLSIGNIFEPRIMGKEMGISPLVVFLSLIIWGWMLGPVGMFMAVPLSMIIKIMLHNYKPTQWLAQLLS